MKKIFVLLFSMWAPIYLSIGLLASCEKSTVDEAARTNEPSQVVTVPKSKIMDSIPIQYTTQFDGKAVIYFKR